MPQKASLQTVGRLALDSSRSMDGERAIHLSGLYVYPIKSCRGISLDVWDADGRFLSQRELPRMALIEVGVRSDHLAVDAPGMPALDVPFEPATNELFPARI